MEARMQRRIQRYGWDKAVGSYEAGWKASLADVQAELLRQADAQPCEHVLDIACGTGLVTLPLAEAVGRGGRVVATDISERMVDAVAQAAGQRRLPQVETFRADAEALDAISDNSMDLVTCALGLMYVADPMRAMAEALRVLRPGGRAVFAVWGERARCGWAQVFPIVDARVQSAVCPLFFRLGTADVMAWEMTATGLEGVTQTRLAAELPYPSAQAAVEAVFEGGPVALAYDRFDAPTRVQVHREYLASIAPYRTPAGYRIPGEFVVCAGRKGRAG